MRILRNNSLSLVVLAIFAATFCAQAIAGRADYNDTGHEFGRATVSMGQYLRTGHFWQAVAENWESEFLQMSCFILFTAHLYQKGSPESRNPDKPMEYVDEDPRSKRGTPGVPWPVKRGGFILSIYSHSLSTVMLLLFALSFALHAMAGVVAFNEEQALHGKPTETLFSYITSGRFWFESMQNWQSEFLSIAAMVLLGIVLRERGSPESKPVAMPHMEQE